MTLHGVGRYEKRRWWNRLLLFICISFRNSVYLYFGIRQRTL